MGTKSENTRYHDPYANLAHAVLSAGIKCNDKSFLESDWCETLREICRLDDEMYGHRNVGTRGKTYISSAHIGVEAN